MSSYLFSARLSPDAYIQLTMQLAWYRTRSEFTATYETVLTRFFHHGRTETLRVLSADTRAWLLAMADPSASVCLSSWLLTWYLSVRSSVCRTSNASSFSDARRRHIPH